MTFKQDGGDKTEEFDTVLFAVDRLPATSGLQLSNAGVVAGANGKIEVNADDQTSAPSIFAVGEAAKGRPELASVAAKAGTLLSQRLFLEKDEQMEYSNVPTTVLTPLEYGCCGLNEEEAVKQFGVENIEVYHTEFKPVEWDLNKVRAGSECYVKVLVKKADGIVAGFHILAPNAAEVAPYVGLSMQCGLTKDKLDKTIAYLQFGMHGQFSKRPEAAQ